MKRLLRWQSCGRRIHSSSAACRQASARLLDPHNAFTCFTPDLVPSDPPRSNALKGLRISVKDNFATRQGTTSCASKTLEGYQSPYDATVVKQLLDHGARIVGKTNMDEFGMGSHGLHSYYGATTNPLNPDMVVGGSSSGAAASVAADMCDAAIGSDTGGSVRLPASYTGIVGFKPSYGRLSRHGLIAYASSLDTVGILSKRVETVKRIFREQASALREQAGTSSSHSQPESLDEHDPRDPTAISTKYRQKAIAAAKRPLRIGVPVECFPAELSQEAIIPVRRALAHLREATGSSIVSVSVPSIPSTLSAYYVLATAEASSNLSRYDGVRYGHRSDGSYSDTRTAAFGEEVQRRIVLGTYALSADAFNNYFLAAQRLRNRLKRDMDKVFRHGNPLRAAYEADDAGVDVLIFPTAISSAPTVERAKAAERGSESYVQDILTVPASLAGLPAISCPVSLPGQGSGQALRPVGVQIVGQWGYDDLVLSVSASLEQGLP